MKKVSSPHDKYFKTIFSKKETMRGFVLNILPDIAPFLRLETLKLDTDSYVDKNLQTHFSDLVYSCESENFKSVKIALLLEHKSYAVKNSYLQLLNYMLKIWEQNYILSSKSEEEHKKIQEKFEDLYENWGFDKGSFADKYFQKGRREGKREGFSEGIKKGEEKGKTEIAFNLIQKGMDNKFIAECIFLRIEEISKIRKRFLKKQKI